MPRCDYAEFDWWCEKEAGHPGRHGYELFLISNALMGDELIGRLRGFDPHSESSSLSPPAN